MTWPGGLYILTCPCRVYIWHSNGASQFGIKRTLYYVYVYISSNFSILLELKSLKVLHRLSNIEKR